jgi:glucose/arabinose dehydrogenase
MNALFSILANQSCQTILSSNLFANTSILIYSRSVLCPLKRISPSLIQFDQISYLVTINFTSSANHVAYYGQLAYNQKYQLCGFMINGLQQQTTYPVSCAYRRPGLSSVNSALKVPANFQAVIIGNVSGARELVALPNGDLIVGTTNTNVYIISNADDPDVVGPITIFATFPKQTTSGSTDNNPEGVAYGNGYVFVSTEKTIWRIPYTNGQKTGTPLNISSVRTGIIAPNSDGDVHHSTSVAVSNSTLYAGVGSSCNACEETDPTRATIQTMSLDGKNMKLRARRWRNPIAFAVDPQTSAVWSGGAGQDNLPGGHPFEYMDPVSLRPTPADYGWPDCEENHIAYTPGANCSQVVIPALVFPAYSTIIGATFYPLQIKGLPYAFPNQWQGGLFVSMHGSWHVNASNVPWDPPHVAFVPFDPQTRMPKTPVDWHSPYMQWIDFFTGFQDAHGNRIGRCTGIAVGPKGSLFVADDQTGNIYRIRATTSIC